MTIKKNIELGSANVTLRQKQLIATIRGKEVTSKCVAREGQIFIETVTILSSKFSGKCPGQKTILLRPYDSAERLPNG